MARNLTETDYELISAYLDGELSDSERLRFETRLQVDAELRGELAALRQTVELIKALPPLTAPRSFTLTEDMLRSSAPPRVLVFPSTTRLSILSAVAAFVLVFAGVVLLISTQGASFDVAAPPAPMQQSAPETFESASGEVALAPTPTLDAEGAGRSESAQINEQEESEVVAGADETFAEGQDAAAESSGFRDDDALGFASVTAEATESILRDRATRPQPSPPPTQLALGEAADGDVAADEPPAEAPIPQIDMEADAEQATDTELADESIPNVLDDAQAEEETTLGAEPETRQTAVSAVIEATATQIANLLSETSVAQAAAPADDAVATVEDLLVAPELEQVERPDVGGGAGESLPATQPPPSPTELPTDTPPPTATPTMTATITPEPTATPTPLPTPTPTPAPLIAVELPGDPGLLVGLLLVVGGLLALVLAVVTTVIRVRSRR